MFIASLVADIVKVCLNGNELQGFSEIPTVGLYSASFTDSSAEFGN